LLPKLCLAVSEETGVSVIAVPERRLGDGIFERVTTLIKIREALNSTGRYIGLHLLGTGNPISISIYSTYGADTFDGLEWCQTVVDHETGALFHFSQADFFAKQTSWETSGLPFQMRVLAHNLEFYSDWMDRLRLQVIEGQGREFCRRNFPPIIYTMCSEELGW
jgi:queuine/archaeosine tRNA-ribosyltransferase